MRKYVRRVRAALILNPNATSTTDQLRDVIAAALRSEVELEVLPTKKRGHATHLAAAAVHDQVDAVFSLGGDGTANEVLQALAGTDVTMGVIPGGGANVMARSLGLPNDPVAATSIALTALREGHRRTIGLGQVNDRYFAFDAGFGFDAAVVRSVEQHPGLKRRFKQAAFVYLAFREWAINDEVRHPHITIEHPDGSTEGPVGIVMLGNADPYTFLGPRPVRMTPQASPDAGIDLTAVRRTGTAHFLAIVGKVLAGGRHLGDDAVISHHDLREVVLTTLKPTPLMVDGDYFGDHTMCRVRSVPSSLHVLVERPGSIPAEPL